MSTEDTDFVEVDPTGRYGRYNEILGKGSSKIVYKAFDEYNGIEVAWNQVKLHDFLQSSEDLERLYCEIHLLKTLNHDNIMKFYTSWVDSTNRNINFVTELFTSGTLRQYRLKHRKVNIRAVKHWCRQILNGLVYLHSRNPPVIHRDLKCDNIFINGNQGEVKIGDLGLAAILRKSHADHCVGTPEFMAPEVYQEEYNELVDIYSFGMCVLEMVTFEYPYSECNHPAQIYKKVVSGTKPEALYRVEDPEVREFVEKCLVAASERLPARELLNDPFLVIDDIGSDMGVVLHQPLHNLCDDNEFVNELYDNRVEEEDNMQYDPDDLTINGIDLFSAEYEPLGNLDISIKGRRKEDGGINLRLRITDEDGRVRNIYFSFDTEADTALSVATEMVAELDITDHEVTRIAEMIDSEVASLVPDWEPGPGMVETPRDLSKSVYDNATSDESSCGSLLDFISHRAKSCGNLQSCSNLETSSMHGRFEEILYQSEETEGASALFSNTSEVDRKLLKENGQVHSRMRKSMGDLDREVPVSNGYESEISQELRWLKADYQMEVKEYKNRNLPPISRKKDDRVNNVNEDDSSSAGSRLESLRKKLFNSFPKRDRVSRISKAELTCKAANQNGVISDEMYSKFMSDFINEIPYF